MTDNQEQQNEEVLANADTISEFGMEAVKKWNSGLKAVGTGDQMAVFALANAWEQLIFRAIVLDKAGAMVRQFSFSLEDYVSKPLLNEDGKTRDNKATNARTVAVCQRVFGIDEPTAAIKQRITRALEVVRFIMSNGYSCSDLEATKTGRLSVPYPLLNDKPKADAGKNELKTWEAMEAQTIELDGKKGRTIAELQRRSRPKPDRKPDTPVADHGQEFVKSVNYTTACLERLMDEKAESTMPAPNNTTKEAMWKLNQILNAFFTADPMVKSEPKRKVNTRASK